MQRAEVGQHDDVLTVVGDRVRAGRVHDQGPEVPHWLLQAGVAVIPVGPRLDDRKLVDEGLARPDARETQARHAVELEGHQQPVPVDRGVLVQAVGDGDLRRLALFETDQRAGRGPVDANGVVGPAIDLDHGMPHAERDLGAGQGCGRRCATGRAPGPRRKQGAGREPASGQRRAVQQLSAVEVLAHHDGPGVGASAE